MENANALSTGQLTAISVTERVNSAISVASILFIAFTYLTTPCFNKPINRLIYFACFGNLGTNIAALIADAGPFAGRESALCRTQAFLVQMFLGVDGLWAFCMAINVYLAFFRGYSVKQFRQLDLWYLLSCYGLSFIPAFTFIFVKTSQRGSIYGPATIWCWITEEWNMMRFALLYAWIWLAIVFALAIYIRAGIVIYQRRRQLSGFLNPLNENPFKATVTTEVHVTSEPMPSACPLAESSGPVAFEEPQHTETTIDVDSPQDASKHEVELPAMFRVRSYTRKLAEDSVNPEAWLYARVAFLFYIALIMTWVPSSINRIYSLAEPGRINFGLSYLASFLFPLQGFWNLVVYVITSQTACRNLFREMFYGGRGMRPTNHQLRENSVDIRRTRERLDSDDDTMYLRGQKQAGPY